MSEASARIKINRLLDHAGWRFFEEHGKPASIRLEATAEVTHSELDALGNDFERTAKGFIDFLLLDERQRPILVLEAKAENLNPLSGKEQARRYAKSMNCRFVILSNGNLHYLWNLERGQPHLITSIPTQASLSAYHRVPPDPVRLIHEPVHDDYVVLTQHPSYRTDAAFAHPSERASLIETRGLRFLRDYQLRAIHAVQAAVKAGKDRFLLEMATGTGKTLTAAALAKLFLQSRNAQRVLFLVDRLELENQAKKDLDKYLSPDFSSVIYKENRADWQRADIVITTVQSLLADNKYQKLFSPTDFDFVISDEAHRSIGGNARAVFDYFLGYKLGLTATPRKYLKSFDPTANNAPGQYERRLLLDTYRTFACEDGQPTFSYTLNEGVAEGNLISPTVVDARTTVTTRLLSESGYVVDLSDEAYDHRDFEKTFFSERTNQEICKAFLENGLADPISGEFGKSILFAVSQRHAARLTEILNAMADRRYPGKYQSDFAVQITSQVQHAQRMSINFANNQLLGSENFLASYKTSKARVCITVGMMTTGYDCPDILNLGLVRPIFSPTDFVQMKGRGTRRENFARHITDPRLRSETGDVQKTAFKLFDFFANCEYFEEEFDYDEVIKLPAAGAPSEGDSAPVVRGDTFTHEGDDILASIKVQVIGPEGMKVDRMLYARFAELVKDDPIIKSNVESGEWDKVIDYVNREVFDKPSEFYSLEKLRRAAAVDRRVSLREILEKVFGLIPSFKSRDALLEEEFNKFVLDRPPPEFDALPAIRNFFKAYVGNDQVRGIIDRHSFGELATNPELSMAEYKKVPESYRELIPEYVKDYVSLNQFAA